MSEISTPREKMLHYGGFLLAGGLAFLTDVGVFQLLHVGFGLAPLIARPLSICVAMAVSWAINRTVTFPMPGPPRLAEFLHFAALAWVAAAFNYAVFALALCFVPSLWPPIGIFISSLAAMALAYLNMRFSVFKKSTHSVK